MQSSLEIKLKYLAKEFLNSIKGEEVIIISHFDTDGITSAAIMIKTLTRLDQSFSLKIVKSLDKEIINSINKNKIILFLDLASGNLKDIEDANLKKTFVIDHHEISQEIPLSIEILNPTLHENQKISASGLAYLFAKEISEENTDLAKLGTLGMIGDTLEKELDKLNNGMLQDGEIKRKRGLLIYPSTRPLNRTLEYSSDPYIPGVTGNIKGVLELLREVGLNPEGGKYKNLIDLTENEMEKLVTAIILRNPEKTNKEIIGDLFLIKLFGKLEDAREISAKINACSRAGKPEVAIGFCLENYNSKKLADSIHVKYRQQLITGIKLAEEIEKINGKGYVIINAKNQIKDTMIGTIMSIISHSSRYEKGTIIIGLANDGNSKIKISARVVGQSNRNLRELLENIMNEFVGEFGGHERAAGCSINQEDEEEFINSLKKHLELEVIKIQTN